MEQPINEVWRSIDGFINYQVSNVGRVRLSKSGRMFTPMANMKGYLFVRLRNSEGVRKNNTIHRLVAQEFLSNPENKPCVDHINRDRTNNVIINLRWATFKDNSVNKTKKQNATSKYIGVCWDSGKHKCHSRITWTYDERAKVAHGEFANLNFP